MAFIGKVLACYAGATLLLAAAAGAQVQAAGDDGGKRYTAQRRPRVAVLEFEDTNAVASNARYGSSVPGMLVTFLQSRSQLVVVERQKLDALYEEKQRIQRGVVNIPPGDTAARQLLEKIDGFIIGDVTVLDGSRVEIDAKLFSGFDGRVVATAQRSGPIGCLRSIVERLGVALEQDFLRPYTGRLKINLNDPENVRVFLTPIPLDTATDGEKSQIERSSTVRIGDDYDTVESWTTSPTTYTMDHILTGWYSMRLERPGYEDLKPGQARWEVREPSGRPEVYDRLTGRPLSQTEPELRRFVVRVDPLTTEVIDGDALKLAFRKKEGSLAFRVKREYLDTDFTQTPQRVILVGKELDLNRSKEAEKPGDPKCSLFREKPLPFPGSDRTYVASGQSFDLDKFKGGELIIEDYRGESIPTGEYKAALWEPYYQVDKIGVAVGDHDLENVTHVLSRQTLSLTLNVTGARPESRAILKGRDTHYQLELPLNFKDTKERRGLPADTYRVSTNVPGLDAWRQTLVLLPSGIAPPRYYTKSPSYQLEISQTPEEARKPVESPNLTLKTRFVLAGRLGILSRLPGPSADLFIDGQVEKILDSLLYGKEQQPELRQLLAQHLEVVDLLVFDPRDMARLRRSPELAAIIEDYVKEGGALFAFVLETGDYGHLVGAPLMVEASKRPTDRFEIAPGEVAGVVPWIYRRADVGLKRSLPEISKPPRGDWRVLAFSQGQENPRIIERGQREGGGYVALWFDDPGSFHDRLKGTVPKVEEARGKIEEHILRWARYLMYRRYDKSGKLRRRAEQALGTRLP
jgi:hypothetical protein